MNDPREPDTQILRKLKLGQKDRARKMHHSTTLTFIDDVSRDVVRNKPLIIINHEPRIHKVVSIINIMTCYTEKISHLINDNCVETRFVKALGFGSRCIAMQPQIACNCERSFIRVRDSAKNSGEVTGGPTANSGENRDCFLRASNSHTFRMKNVIVREINFAY